MTDSPEQMFFNSAAMKVLYLGATIERLQVMEAAWEALVVARTREEADK